MSSSSSAAAGSVLGSPHAGLGLSTTAMVLSGTLVLLSLCRAKPHQHLLSSDGSGAPDAATTAPSPAQLRPASSPKWKREKARRGRKKRMRFADDVLENGAARSAPEEEAKPSYRGHTAATLRTMPANREALYCGMLRGRSMLRVACSH